MPVQIERALPADAEAIASILCQAFAEFKPCYSPDGFAATVVGPTVIRLRIEEGPVWRAVSNGHIVGTVAAVQKSTGVYVRGMAVVPATRGIGIGRQLLAQAESFAIQCRATRLFLSTTPFLEGAIRLYRRFGFKATSDEPHDLYGTPLLTMEKILTSAAQACVRRGMSFTARG